MRKVDLDDAYIALRKAILQAGEADMLRVASGNPVCEDAAREMIEVVAGELSNARYAWEELRKVSEGDD